VTFLNGRDGDISIWWTHADLLLSRVRLNQNPEGEGFVTKEIFAAGLAFLTVVTPAHAADQYLCVPDKAVGFAYNKTTKQWESMHLKTSQFVIAPSKDGKAAYTVTDIGDKYLPGYCDKDFTDVGMLFCDTFGGDLKFNRVSGRFLRVFYLAYYNVGIPGPATETDEDSGTPMIEIGKCASF
jgi:hypothetical protein